MSQKQEISVIIPAYNCADSIVRCVHSVLDQTVSAFEVIVIDDHSMDATADIVESIKDFRVRLIRLERNFGAQAARNCGIREARGKWIAFQDADDEWLPEKLEKQLACLNNVGNDEMTVVHTDVFWSGKAHKGDLPVSLPLVDGDSALEVLLQGPGPLLQGILVSRKALAVIGYLDEAAPAYHEWDTAIRLARVCRFIHLREQLVHYYRQPGSISSNGRRDLSGYQYVMDKFSDLIRSSGNEHIWEDHLLKQTVRAMAFGLWDDAERFLEQNKSVGWRSVVLRIFIGLHVSPHRFMRITAYLRQFVDRK